MICVKCDREVPDGARWCCWCGLKDPFTPRVQNRKTRGNGQGTVFKDSRSGKWVAKVCIGSYDGKMHFRSKYGIRTKTEALGWLEKLKETNYTNERDMTVQAIYAAMSPRWYASISAGKEGHYQKAWERLKPLWNADIRNLIAEDWQQIIDQIPGKFDPKKDAKTVASKIYQYAIAQGWITVNMTEYVTLPGQDTPNKDAFTHEELARLWSGWEDRQDFTGYILIMCYTGMRPGELRKTMIENIFVEECYMVEGIKSAAGIRRCVAFPAFLQPVLRWAIERGKNGKLLAINEENFYKRYDEALEAAEIVRTEQRRMTPHCCRHTFVTEATNAEIPLAIVQKMAGHADISTTTGYNHSHDPELIRAAQRLYNPSENNQ